MTLRWLLAFLHLLALPIGAAAVLMRARALRTANIQDAVKADAWWGIAALIWISTGLWRWLAGVEKPMEYYTHNWLFLTKLALLLVILAFELRPIIVIGRWRSRLRRNEPMDTTPAQAMATTSTLQFVLTLLMVLAATGMARGMGVFG